MADMFKCDKCGMLGPPHMKRGRLILQEIKDGQTHVAYYNRQAEVCERCFKELCTLMNKSTQTPTLAESNAISMVKP